MLEKNKGEVLSGESIAGELGCTRAAVWKCHYSCNLFLIVCRLPPTSFYCEACQRKYD